MLFQATVRAHSDNSSFDVGNAVIFVDDRGVEDGAAMDFVWDAASSKAIEKLWDARLDATDNTPNVELSACTSWVVAEGYVCANVGQCRLLFDVRLKSLLGVASLREGTWLPLNPEEAMVLEGELRETGLFDDPDNWGEGEPVESWRELPDWAQLAIEVAA